MKTGVCTRFGRSFFLFILFAIYIWSITFKQNKRDSTRNTEKKTHTYTYTHTTNKPCCEWVRKKNEKKKLGIKSRGKV